VRPSYFSWWGSLGELQSDHPTPGQVFPTTDLARATASLRRVNEGEQAHIYSALCRAAFGPVGFRWVNWGMKGHGRWGGAVMGK
jgi:hypothetical protein